MDKGNRLVACYDVQKLGFSRTDGGIGLDGPMPIPFEVKVEEILQALRYNPSPKELYIICSSNRERKVLATIDNYALSEEELFFGENKVEDKMVMEAAPTKVEQEIVIPVEEKPEITPDPVEVEEVVPVVKEEEKKTEQTPVEEPVTPAPVEEKQNKQPNKAKDKKQKNAASKANQAIK